MKFSAPSQGAGSSAGGSSGDPLNLAYFTAQSRLPTNLIKNGLTSFLAPDYSNITGGTLTRSLGQAKFTPGATHSNWGYALGASYTKVLFVCRSIKARTYSCGLHAGVTQPAAAHPPDGYMGLYQPWAGGVNFNITENVGGTSESSVATTTDWAYGDAATAPYVGMALYVDGTAHVQELYISLDGVGWFKACSGADATGTTFNSASFFCGSQSNSDVFFSSPWVIYAS